MKHQILLAGVSQSVITPPVGVFMSGWDPRAAGDTKAHYIHDDLYVKALVLRRDGRAWVLITADLSSLDAIATARIRHGIAEQTDLVPEAIMVCVTHTHSGPIVCPVASTYSPDEMDRYMIKGNGIFPTNMGKTMKVSSSVRESGQTDVAWKEWFLTQAIETAVDAWRSLKPAVVAFGQAEVRGVASSRRLFMSDGSWGDPRRDLIAGIRVISCTKIDPLVRIALFQEHETKKPLAAIINYGSHPWIFCGSGISAELAGATSNEVASTWKSLNAETPIILYTTAPEGDVSLIGNIDVEQVWKIRPGENVQESLTRREKSFEKELARLSKRLAEGVMAAISGVNSWDSTPELNARRQEVALPLKKGYHPPTEVLLSDWQKPRLKSLHLTEIQVLQVGEGAILGLPGEPFSSLGRDIQAQSPFSHLLITALANESGAISYIADQEAYDMGGYEIAFSPVGRGAGEILVEKAVELLRWGKP